MIRDHFLTLEINLPPDSVSIGSDNSDKVLNSLIFFLKNSTFFGGKRKQPLYVFCFQIFPKVPVVKYCRKGY